MEVSTDTSCKLLKHTSQKMNVRVALNWFSGNGVYLSTSRQSDWSVRQDVHRPNQSCKPDKLPQCLGHSHMARMI